MVVVIGVGVIGRKEMRSFHSNSSREGAVRGGRRRRSVDSSKKRSRSGHVTGILKGDRIQRRMSTERNIQESKNGKKS